MRGFRYVLSLVLTICCLSLTANAVCVRNICIPDIPNPNAPPTKCLPAPLAPPIETANPTVAAISTANARLPSSTTTPRFRRAEAAETCYYPTGFLKNVLVEGGTSPLIVLPVGQYKMRWVPLVKDKSLEREGVFINLYNIARDGVHFDFIKSLTQDDGMFSINGTTPQALVLTRNGPASAYDSVMAWAERVIQ